MLNAFRYVLHYYLIELYNQINILSAGNCSEEFTGAEATTDRSIPQTGDSINQNQCYHHASGKYRRFEIPSYNHI